MRRISWYASTEAVAAVEAAVAAITDRLGPSTPRHVALSALLLAGADQVDAVAGHLLADRAAQLAAELAKLTPPAPAS